MFEFGWQGFALLAGGLFCVCIEVLIPSGGLLGIAAASCLGFGGWFAYRVGGIEALIGYATLAVLLVPATALSTLKLLPLTPLGKRVILRPEWKDRQATDKSIKDLLGSKGTAITVLHPSGIASFDHRRVDVVTRGESIESGSAVRVILVEGNRVVVECVRGE